MKRLWLLVLAVVVACSEQGPPNIGGPNLDLNCIGLPNGGVVGVVVTPSFDTVHVTNTPHYDTLTAAVWRDDPNAPGIQFYCRDYSASVTWTALPVDGGGIFNGLDLTPLSGQRVQVFAERIPTHGSSWPFKPYSLVVGASSNKADTTKTRIFF